MPNKNETKKWTDCPSCGAKETMVIKKGVFKSFTSKKYPPVKIGPLEEYVCRDCREEIYTIESGNLVESKLGEHRAREDAKTTAVCEVVHVSDAAKTLKMTKQGVIKLMLKGKLPYVFFGKSRLPKKKAVSEYGLSSPG